MKKSFTIFLLCLSAINLFGQSWHTYTVSNTNGKLPDNNVECLAVDASGNIWMGTYFSGLVKFDGTNWTNYNTSNSPLKDKTIVDVAVDNLGNVWVANYANGVFRFNPTTNTWTHYTKESGALTDNYTYAIGIGIYGYIYVGLRVTSYTSSGLLRWDGLSWVPGPVFKDDYNSYSCESIAVDKNNNVWCGTQIGLYKLDGNNWTFYTKENTNGGLGGNYIRTIAGDALGNTWVGTTEYANFQTRGGGLSRFNGSTWTLYNSTSHPVDDFISAIAFRNNDVWLGTGFCGQFGNRKGIYVFNGTTFTSYQSQTTFPGDCVNDMVVDKNGTVWIGSAFGLSKYGNIVSVWNSNEELPDKFLLNQNYPNPFNPATTISYQLPEESFVTLKVFDILGREIATLVNEHKPAGMYNVTFNAHHPGRSREITSGVYIYTLSANGFVLSKKMLLAK
ncbi:MAG: two-component regulator propeller domain-containing protein [Bacteroidota bacterium]